MCLFQDSDYILIFNLILNLIILTIVIIIIILLLCVVFVSGFYCYGSFLA